LSILFSSCFISKPVPGVQSEVLLDQELAADYSTCSINRFLTFNSQVKYKFGDFELIRMSKNNPLSRHDSHTAGGMIVLSRTISNQYHDTYSLTIALKTDTANGIFTVISQTIEKKPATLDILKGKDKPSDYSKTRGPKILKGEFRITGRSTTWEFEINDYTPGSLKEELWGSRTPSGLLTNLETSYKIMPLKKVSRSGNKSSGDVSIAGISLWNKYDKSVAAIETTENQRLWISNRVESEHKLAVAVLFVAIISSLDINH
jgi:hypothetical protein